MITLVLAGTLGYLLGSFPTAFLLVRKHSGLDIREAGSGNVGTLNSYEVTGSRAVGIGVLLVDFGKGALAVVAGSALGGTFSSAALAGLMAVAGHNFPVWLAFRGGRGLATAAGGMLLLCPPLILFWGGLWCVAMMILRSVNPASGVACLGIVPLIFLPPRETMVGLLPAGADVAEFQLFAVALLLLILVKLFEPMKEYVAGLRSSVKAGK